MTDEFESITQRLQNSPALAAAIKRQIEGGLLERHGHVERSDGAGSGGDLESIDSPAALEAIVQRVGRPPLLIQERRGRVRRRRRRQPR